VNHHFERSITDNASLLCMSG